MTIQWTHQWWASAPSPTHPERNEDGWWIAASRQAAAVIDGMGGYRRRTAQGEIGGEHAAAISMRVLKEQLDRWDASLTLAESKIVLRAAIEAVNKAIWEELNHAGQVPASENLQNKPLEELTVGVALTIIALCDNGSRAVAAQQGDTHGYVLKDDIGLLQITEDQDRLLWDKMNGMITEDEAAAINEAIDAFDGVTIEAVPEQRVLRYFYDKNIFGALGVDGNCPTTGWSAIKLQPRNRLVLLSDGAYSNCSLNELNGLAWLENDPAGAIVDLAVQRSVLPRLPNALNPDHPYNMRATQDDMTAVVVVVGESDEAPPAPEAAPIAADNDSATPVDQSEIPTEPMPDISEPPVEPMEATTIENDDGVAPPNEIAE